MKDLASVTIGRRTFVRMLGMSATIPLAAWIVAACGDDDDDDTAGGEATSETSGESSSTEGAATTEGSTAESSAAENTPAEEAAQSGGDVVIGLDQEPPTLDPHASPSAVTYQIISSVTESLLYLDSERQLQPWLAEEWDTSEDGTSYTFTLRQDVTFHDGEPFNAEAVQWNFDRIVSPDFEAGSALTALSGYTGSEVVDEYTVKVNFEKAYGPFLTYAAGGTLGMVSPKAVQELGDDFGTQVVGSGPFKVDSYTASDNTVIVRNEDYNRQAPWSDREGPALLDSITFKFIPEPSTRIITVETGETNLVQSIPSQDLPRLESNEDITVTKMPWTGVPRILMLNTQLAPTDDVNVRKAVSLAIDRQSLVDTVFAGIGDVAIGMLTKVMLDDPSLSQPYDPDQAKQILDDAGWTSGGDVREKDGNKLTFILNVVDYGGGAPPEAQLIQANLNDVGFDCQIKAQARAPWYEDNYNCATNGPLMFLRSGDYDGLFAMFHSSMIGQNFGFACLDNPDIDNLLEQGRQETDPDTRRETYLKAEQMLADVAAAAPLVDEFSVWAGQASVQGLMFNGFTYPVLSDLSIQS